MVGVGPSERVRVGRGDFSRPGVSRSSSCDAVKLNMLVFIFTLRSVYHKVSSKHFDVNNLRNKNNPTNPVCKRRWTCLMSEVLAGRGPGP